MPNNITYYKFDIDLRNYTQNKINTPTNSPYRIFSIKAWLASNYFEILTNNLFNILEYTIYMSNQSVAGSPQGKIGLNLIAMGRPQNYYLDAIQPTLFSILRTNDYNYLSIIATTLNTRVNIIIEDLLF